MPRRASTEWERYYECRECGHREFVGSYRASCPICDGQLRNIAVARE